MEKRKGKPAMTILFEPVTLSQTGEFGIRFVIETDEHEIYEVIATDTLWLQRLTMTIMDGLRSMMPPPRTTFH